MYRFIVIPLIVAAAAFAGTFAAIAAWRTSSYAENRAEIENLEARYMFALDWQDAEQYAATFTEDGVLDWAFGTIKGREAIRKEFETTLTDLLKTESADPSGRPSRFHHHIDTLVLKVDGDRAAARAFWFEINDNTADHSPHISGYGLYEDDLRRVNGEWLFAKRKIYSEQVEGRGGPAQNPSW